MTTRYLSPSLLSKIPFFGNSYFTNKVVWLNGQESGCPFSKRKGFESLDDHRFRPAAPKNRTRDLSRNRYSALTVRPRPPSGKKGNTMRLIKSY